MHLVMSTGCPSSIGPEVSVLAAVRSDPSRGSIALVGDARAIRDAAALHAIALDAFPHVSVLAVSDLAPADRVPGRPSALAGRAQFAALDRAIDEVLAGRADAIVTAAVSKHAITSAGIPFVGHTEHLQARTHSPRVVMSFLGPRLKTALVTTHHALSAVPARITRDAVCETVLIATRAMRDLLGIERPRVAVVGLNPHAGEGGLFGHEDAECIAPAVATARGALPFAEIAGPVPAEGAFRQARDGRWDLVVAMYHDQATIASKLLDFGDAVNVTLGLPIVRTSVDHGTAYDIAGRGVADPSGMVAALEMAFTMVSRLGLSAPRAGS